MRLWSPFLSFDLIPNPSVKINNVSIVAYYIWCCSYVKCVIPTRSATFSLPYYIHVMYIGIVHHPLATGPYCPLALQ